MKRRVIRVLLPLFIVIIAVGGIYVWSKYPTLALFSAYKAKWVCSEVFVAGRTPEAVRDSDFNDGDLAALKDFKTEIDEPKGTVTVSYFGLAKRTAVYRPDIGASLAIGVPAEDLRRETVQIPKPAPLDRNLPWPEGESTVLPPRPEGMDSTLLDTAMAAAFPVPDPVRTRAIVVVYDGRIVAEKYVEGFGPSTPIGGWSMTKSATNAIIGVAVHKGILQLEDANLFEAWRGAGDKRSKIRIIDLLRWSSGLGFDETYTDPNGDAARMLFRSGDAPGFAARMKLKHSPGSVIHYSSGDSNLLGRALREKIGDDTVYHSFPARELFHRIGAHSMIMERDASGNFVGSSFLYATPRDWARLGLLFANDGVWSGVRILPEGWVDNFARGRPPAKKTNPPEKHSRFSRHFHIRVPTSDAGLKQPSPLPASAFHMSGFLDQYVTIIPERKLVVVRLGLTMEGAWDHEGFVKKVLEALP